MRAHDSYGSMATYFEYVYEDFGPRKGSEFLNELSDYKLYNRTQYCGVIWLMNLFISQK